MRLERLDRIGVVGGDEYDQRTGLRIDLLHQAHAIESWHLDVEKHETWCVALDRGECLVTVAALRDDAHLRMRSEHMAHEIAPEGFVVDDNRSDRGVIHRQSRWNQRENEADGARWDLRSVRMDARAG
jgi:hypothetical protein